MQFLVRKLILIYLRITLIPQFQSNVTVYFEPSSANDDVELYPMQNVDRYL